MNYVIAKIKGKDSPYEKIYSGEDIFSLPDGLDNAVEYASSMLIEEDEWFKIENFSKKDFFLEILSENFRSTDFAEAKRVLTDTIEYIMSYQNGYYYFQRILKHSIMSQKRIVFENTVKLDKGARSIVINDTPDAIYDKSKDTIFFKVLSMIAPIFKGIDKLFREATEEETQEFINNDFIELADGYSIEKIKNSNRKRIAMAIDTLKEFGRAEKNKILDYTHNYYPDLKYDKKRKVFTVCNEDEMKYLLWGIEQRYFTTPVTNERRVANSIIKL